MDVLQAIQFSEIQQAGAGFSKLFSDYLSNFSALRRFYQYDYRSLQGFADAAEARKPAMGHRDLLADVLLEQNKSFGAGEESLRHIEELRAEQTFAVVTGQQVGILGGPLYTIYKTISAVKLARQLRDQLPGYAFVPVFWLEGEDHDFEEMNKIVVLSQEGSPASVEFPHPSKQGAKSAEPVGKIKLGAGIEAFFDQLAKALPTTEFREALLQRLKSVYTSEATFSGAFAALLHSLFPDEGLVIIDANDRRLKQLTRHIFLNELETFPRISQKIIQQSASLEEQYHAQIKTKAMNLFLVHNGGRYLIEPREHDFALRGTRQYFTREELLRILDESPEAFSPNVALRPICQDTILPTAAYVAGPSEVAYFAQLKPVYDYFSCPMPVIYPRASATVVEERQQKILEKYQLSIGDVFRQPTRLQQHVIDMVSEVKIDELFTHTSAQIGDLLQEMRFGLTTIDPTLLGPLDATRDKVDGALQVLKQKAAEAQQRKHEIALRQIRKVQNFFLPNGDYQERALNLFSFVNRYGDDFLPWLKSTLNVDQFEHQLLYL